MFRRALVFAALALVPLLACAQSEVGVPLMDVFGVRDYEAQNQMWGAVQDRAGTIYVGNRDVVLAYDGFGWRQTRTDGIFVRGLAIDANDRIWAGGVSELGYLDNDGRGGRVYTSLRDRVPEADRDFGGIFWVFALPHGIYFVTETRLLRWHEGRFSIEPISNSRAFAVSDELFHQNRDGPLRATLGNGWRIVADTPAIRASLVTFITRQPDGAWLIGLRDDGFWRLRGGAIERWATSIDATLRTRFIDRGRVLRDGTLVVAHRPSGVSLLDPQGRLLHHLDTGNGGLPTGMVINILEDRDGAVWLSLNSGMARLAWPAAVTTFDRNNGLDRGTIRALHRHGGRLYCATSEGVFLLEPAAPGENPPRRARFVLVPQTATRIWTLASARETLVAAGMGLLVIEPDGTVADLRPGAPGTVARVLRADPDRILFGTTARVERFRRVDGRWLDEGPLPGIEGEIRDIIETADGSVWVPVANHGFYRVLGLPGTASADGGAPRVEHYPGGHGFRSERVNPLPILTPWRDEAAFLDAKGIFRFDPTTRRFVELAAPPRAVEVAPLEMPTLGTGADGRLWTRTLRSDPEAGPWHGRVFWRVTLPSTWEALPFSVADVVGESPVFLEEAAERGTTLWLGGSEGLVRVELPKGFVAPTTFRTRIARAADTAGRPFPLGPASTVQLPFDARTLALEFATDRLDTRHMRFQTRLDGRETDAWSRLSAESRLMLDGLPAGRHVVAVRARDANGRVAEPAFLTFEILPPWSRSGWAFALYALGGASGVAGFVRWRLRAIRRRNEELEAIIATRTRELREAKSVAESANHAKSAFLANMSHELRTPLNAILGYAQILRREDGLSEKGRHQLGIVGRNGEHLLQMINEVLDLAKIEAGKMTLHATEFPLVRVVKTAADLFEQRANDKGLAFRFELGPGLPKIVATDEQKLRQVLLNLLGNAVKFTERGEMVLSVTRLNGHIRFEVRDTGPGIAPDQLDAIFEPFHQATTAASAQGTGLGLPISRRIVGLMGGKIEVESLVGQGSRFWFEVALPEVTPTAARTATIATITGYHGPRRRLLIADDEPTNRAVLRDLLEPIGFVIEEAADGAAAVAAITQQRYDALLLDLRMPVLGGLEAVPRLRAWPHGRTLPIIAVSASVLGFNQGDALAAGCDDFLAKPVQEKELLAALGRALRLEWTYCETAVPFETTAPATADGALPEMATLDALLALARGGDVDALREQIAALLAQGSPGTRLLREIDALAAGFKTADIRQKLTDARQRAPAS